MSGCATCGWPNRSERTPPDDCPLFGDPEHDSLDCHDCWGICDALCERCGRPVRSGTVIPSDLARAVFTEGEDDA